MRLKQKHCWYMAEVAECLLSTPEDLGSIPSTGRKQKKGKSTVVAHALNKREREKGGKNRKQKWL
jgi:hypothetical protein